MRPANSRHGRLFATIATTMAPAMLLLIVPADAIGQDQYPERLIKIIVPVQAGSGPDSIARIIAEKLQSKWNKPVVVENRPGASGSIGAKAVAQAEPDGYTLLVAPPAPFAINQHLFDNLRDDPAAFVPITVIAEAPNVLVVRPGLGVGSLAELIALARSLPRKLTYGALGKGSTMHLAMELLRSRAGIDMVHVAYKSPPQYLNDMLGGIIDLAFVNLIFAVPLVESGQVMALAIDSAERSALLSNVPALAETFPGFVSTSWFAVAAPPKTPPQIAENLSSAIAAALREPDAMAKLQSLKVTPVLNSPSEAVAFFRAESERWRKVIVAAGIKPE